MIEFTTDGPFSEKADQLFPGRVRIIGLGQTGAAVCDQLVLHGRPGQDLWVFDSDQLTIEGSVVPNRHLLGLTLVHGLGCSGDLELAREVVALEETRLAPVARGCDFLILVLGLGGSTGVALAEHLIGLGRDAGAKVIVVGVQPFAFEGWSRREKAVEAIAELRREADSVLVLAHDRIAENPATVKNIRHGFHLMHQLLAQTAQALSQIVCKRGLIQLSFADVRSLYGRYSGSEVLENCWAAHVEGDLHDRTEDLMAELLASPLLSDESIWKRIDHAIVAVSGTRDLGLSEVQEMVGALKDRLPVNIPIATSASLDEESHDKVRMTVLLAMTAPARSSAAETPAKEQRAAPAKKVSLVTETAPMPSIKLEKKSSALTKTGPMPGVKSEKKSSPLAKTGPMPSVKVEARLEPPITVPLPNPNKPKLPRPPVEPQQPKDSHVTVENHTIPEEPAPLQLEAEPVAPVPAPTRTSRRFQAKQEEMQFEAPTRGRFEKTHETMYNGENLDQPTFRRRRLKIRV